MIDATGQISVTERNIFHRHVYGTSKLLYDYEKQKVFIFVPIPKSASSYVKACFKKARQFHFELNRFYHFESNTVDQDLPYNLDVDKVLGFEKNYVVVLRDPVSRWIAGLAQILPQADLRDISLQQLVENPRQFVDNHLEPQISFLHGMPFDSVTWFYLDRYLTENLRDWTDKNHLQYLMQFPDTAKDYENSFQISDKKSSQYRDFVDRMKQYVQSDQNYHNKILSCYQDDTDLIAKIKLGPKFFGSA
jgi:hypothetical protein